MTNILKYQNPSSPLLAPKDTSDIQYLKFKETLPDNLRLTPEKDYHMYDYWRLNGKPKDFNQGVEWNMFGWDNSDKGWHAGSIAEDKETGIYHFMKPKHHPTVQYELDWFNKGLRTLEGGKQVPVRGKHKKFWEDFTSKYQLDTTGVDYRYVPIKKKGGNIHIKKKNRGKFTEYCGGKVTEECIRKGKNSSDPAVRKRAVFAQNARRWKHENGGILKAQFGLSMINPSVVQHQLKNRIAPLINEHGKKINQPLFESSSGARLAAQDRAKLMWKHGDRLSDNYKDHAKLVVDQVKKEWYENPINNRTNSQKAAILSLLGQSFNFAGPWGVAAARIVSIPDQIYDWAASVAEPTNVRNHAHTGANYLEDLAKLTPTKYDDILAPIGKFIGNADDATSGMGYDLFNWSKKKD